MTAFLSLQCYVLAPHNPKNEQKLEWKERKNKKKSEPEERERATPLRGRELYAENEPSFAAWFDFHARLATRVRA